MSRILLFQCNECVVKMLKSETTLFACEKQLEFYRTKKKQQPINSKNLKWMWFPLTIMLVKCFSRIGKWLPLMEYLKKTLSV